MFLADLGEAVILPGIRNEGDPPTGFGGSLAGRKPVGSHWVVPRVGGGFPGIRSVSVALIHLSC